MKNVFRWSMLLVCLSFMATGCTEKEAAPSKDWNFTRIGDMHRVPLPADAEPDAAQTRGKQKSFTMRAPVKTVRDRYLIRLIDDGWLVHSDVTPQHYRIKKGSANLHLFITRSDGDLTRITLRPAKEDLLEWLRMLEKITEDQS